MERLIYESGKLETFLVSSPTSLIFCKKICVSRMITICYCCYSSQFVLTITIDRIYILMKLIWRILTVMERKTTKNLTLIFFSSSTTTNEMSNFEMCIYKMTANLSGWYLNILVRKRDETFSNGFCFRLKLFVVV